ncbi:MAG: sulfotransferase [Pseudomonadota bacterium]
MKLRSDPTIDFIGIGAARSGTSWITNILRAHPQVCISEPKEIRYFNRFVLPVGPVKDQRNSSHDRDMEWYMAHFQHGRPDQLKGEYSPVYLYDKAAPAAIQSAFPNVKLIACLRNPVDRAYSHYWLHRGSSIMGKLSFEEAIEREPVYIDMGFYASQLSRYFEIFDQQQLLVLIFEELIQQPKAQLGRLFEFLDIRNDAALVSSRFDRNPPTNIRARSVKRMAFSMSQTLIRARLSFVLKAFRSLGVHTVLKKLYATPLERPSISEETRGSLNVRFAQETARLESLLGRKLETWKDWK